MVSTVEEAYRSRLADLDGVWKLAVRHRFACVKGLTSGSDHEAHSLREMIIRRIDARSRC